MVERVISLRRLVSISGAGVDMMEAALAASGFQPIGQDGDARTGAIYQWAASEVAEELAYSRGYPESTITELLGTSKREGSVAAALSALGISPWFELGSDEPGRRRHRRYRRADIAKILAESERRKKAAETQADQPADAGPAEAAEVDLASEVSRLHARLDEVMAAIRQLSATTASISDSTALLIDEVSSISKAVATPVITVSPAAEAARIQAPMIVPQASAQAQQQAPRIEVMVVGGKHGEPRESLRRSHPTLDITFSDVEIDAPAIIARWDRHDRHVVLSKDFIGGALQACRRAVTAGQVHVVTGSLSSIGKALEQIAGGKA